MVAVGADDHGQRTAGVDGVLRQRDRARVVVLSLAHVAELRGAAGVGRDHEPERLDRALVVRAELGDRVGDRGARMGRIDPPVAAAAVVGSEHPLGVAAVTDGELDVVVSGEGDVVHGNREVQRAARLGGEQRPVHLDAVCARVVEVEPLTVERGGVVGKLDGRVRQEIRGRGRRAEQHLGPCVHGQSHQEESRCDEPQGSRDSASNRLGVSFPVFHEILSSRSMANAGLSGVPDAVTPARRVFRPLRRGRYRKIQKRGPAKNQYKEFARFS